MDNRRPNFFLRFLTPIWRGYDALGRFFLHFFVLIAVIIFISSILSDDKVKVEKDSVLILAPKGEIVDQLDQVNPRDLLQVASNDNPQTLLKDILDALENAKDDNRIKALVISTRSMSRAGISKLQEIGDAIIDFKTSGKKVIAYGENLSQAQYYLASFADEVYLSHQGGIGLTGFGSYRVYMKGLLDKLGVNYHIFRVGTYKSAVEPFMRKDMSKESREANLAFLTDLWTGFKEDIAKQRDFGAHKIDQYADNMLENLKAANGNEANMALEHKLIDGIKNRVEFKNYMMETFGENKDGDSYKKISFTKYLKAIRSPIEIDDPSSDKIAVIVAKGQIVDGSAKEGTIGGDSLAKLIEKARRDDKVKALVLRVDSPGGSAAASEVIRQQVLAVKAAGKPVVVSMGSLAASGGYWISANANEIWASPSTITGSIGVFGMIPTFEKPMQEFFDLHRDGVGTNKFTNGIDIYNGIEPTLAEAIQIGVESIYDKFLTIVSEGRDMPKEAVDKIAQGRVWSGNKALELGLVDKLGELDDAIKSAAAMAKIDDYDVKYIKRDLSYQEQLIKQLMDASVNLLGPAEAGNTVPGSLEQAFSSFITELKTFSQFNDPKHIYAHCFCDVK